MFSVLPYCCDSACIYGTSRYIPRPSEYGAVTWHLEPPDNQTITSTRARKTCFDSTAVFQVQSVVVIGAVLSQVKNGEEKVISYASHVLIKPQRRYCTTRKELLAVVKFTRHFKHYLLGRRFTLRTDHNSLVRFKHIEGQLARWLEEV